MIRYANFTDVAQMLITALKTGSSTETYFCFQPEEAKQITTILYLYYTGRNQVLTSFFNNPEKDKTVAFRVIKNDLWNNKGVVRYLSTDVEQELENIETKKFPKNIRDLILYNFY